MKRSSLTWKLVAATAAIVGFAACSSEPDPPTPDATVSSDGEKKVLRLYSWAEYFDEEVLKAFEAETGIGIEYLSFSTTDEMEQRLKSEPGRWDVIVADDSILEQMWELKLIRELDHRKVPNLKNIDPKYRNMPFDPGNQYSAPYMWGTTLVAYRKDKISDPGDSWSLLWDERNKGRVMMIGERFEVLSIPLLMLGHTLNSPEPAHMEAATNLLLKQIDQVDVRIGDDADVREGLDDGSVWAAMCYSGDAALVAEKNENVGFFIPKEGAPLWIDCFAVVRDTNLPAEAHQLVNFMLEAQHAAANSNATCYASPNAAAREFIDKELLDDPSINPPAEVMERCQFFTKLDAERESFLNGAWLKVHNRLREKQAAAEAAAGVATSGVDPELDGADED